MTSFELSDVVFWFLWGMLSGVSISAFLTIYFEKKEGE